eukprot:6994406-Prymnesium_polylepis.1
MPQPNHPTQLRQSHCKFSHPTATSISSCSPSARARLQMCLGKHPAERLHAALEGTLVVVRNDQAAAAAQGVCA